MQNKQQVADFCVLEIAPYVLNSCAITKVTNAILSFIYYKTPL